MTYVYECPGCGKQHEKRQPMTASVDPECPHCHGSGAFRVVTGGCGVIFKGTGFYCTDKIQRQNVEDKPWARNYQGHRTGQ